MRKYWRKFLIAVLGIASSLMAALLFLAFVGPRGGYDAERLAAAERKMWQAYYAQDQAALAWHLVHAVRRQFGVGYWDAVATSRLLAASAMKFKAAKPGEYEAAMPELTAAYERMKVISNGTFEPAEAARVELQWWIDRRDPNRRDPQNIGSGITKLYETIYCYQHPGFTKAGDLRAQAAHVRDQGRENCDWNEVEKLLILSYQALEDGIERR